MLAKTLRTLNIYTLHKFTPVSYDDELCRANVCLEHFVDRNGVVLCGLSLYLQNRDFHTNTLSKWLCMQFYLLRIRQGFVAVYKGMSVCIIYICIVICHVICNEYNRLGVLLLRMNTATASVLQNINKCNVSY